MGSYAATDRYYDTCNRTTKSFGNILNTTCKNSDVPLKNGLTGNFLSKNPIDVNENVLDFGNPFKNGDFFPESSSEPLTISLFTDPSTIQENSGSEHDLCDMLSLTLSLCEDSLLKNATTDGKDVSLADLYFGGGKQPLESEESNVYENSLEQLLANASRNDTSLKTSASDCMITNNLLNSFCFDAGSNGNGSDYDAAQGQSVTSSSYGSNGTGDLNFSLADLYYNSNKSGEQLKPAVDSQQDVEEPFNLEDSLRTSKETVEQSDSEICSSSQGDEEEEDSVDGNVDLCSAVKTSFDQDFKNSYHFPGASRLTFQKSNLVKKKPSLFCRVLCARPKKNSTSIPKYASNLHELVEEKNHNKFFCFDRPSPDDFVKEKQSSNNLHF